MWNRKIVGELIRDVLLQHLPVEQGKSDTSRTMAGFMTSETVVPAGLVERLTDLAQFLKVEVELTTIDKSLTHAFNLYKNAPWYSRIRAALTGDLSRAMVAGIENTLESYSAEQGLSESGEDSLKSESADKCNDECFNGGCSTKAESSDELLFANQSK